MTALEKKKLSEAAQKKADNYNLYGLKDEIVIQYIMENVNAKKKS